MFSRHMASDQHPMPERKGDMAAQAIARAGFL